MMQLLRAFGLLSQLLSRLRHAVSDGDFLSLPKSLSLGGAVVRSGFMASFLMRAEKFWAVFLVFFVVFPCVMLTMFLF